MNTALAQCAAQPKTNTLPLIATIILAVGCSAQKSPSDIAADIEKSPPVAAMQEEINKLRMELALVKLQVDSLAEEEAVVSTETKGYGIARTKFGPFTASVNEVTPYLDGHKVKLSIGNLTTATFSDPTINLTWGMPYDKKMSYEEWEKSRKKRSVKLTEKLNSGAFTDVEVILTPSKPEEIKNFYVGFELNKLSLRTR